MSVRISFSIPEEKKEEIDRIVQDKGFRGASDLARFAVYQYIARYPVKNGLHVRADPVRDK